MKNLIITNKQNVILENMEEEEQNFDCINKKSFLTKKYFFNWILNKYILLIKRRPNLTKDEC